MVDLMPSLSLYKTLGQYISPVRASHKETKQRRKKNDDMTKLTLSSDGQYGWFHPFKMYSSHTFRFKVRAKPFSINCCKQRWLVRSTWWLLLCGPINKTVYRSLSFYSFNCTPCAIDLPTINKYVQWWSGQFEKLRLNSLNQSIW